VKYKNEIVKLPKKYDDVSDKVVMEANGSVEVWYDHVENNTNQFTHLVNDRILPNYPKPDKIMIIEVDHIFRKDQLEKALELSDQHVNCTTKPIELWKTPAWRIPQRDRMCTVFWDMKNLDKLPETGRQGNSFGMAAIDAYTHNFGFCFNEKTMYWKHLLALGFSQKIGDSMPDELWYDRWLNWKPEDRDLEISAGSQSAISHAYPYDFNELPEVIKEKYGKA